MLDYLTERHHRREGERYIGRPAWDWRDAVGDDELISAFREGQVTDLARGSTRGRVDAAFLRRCCLELKSQIDPKGSICGMPWSLGALIWPG